MRRSFVALLACLSLSLVAAGKRPPGLGDVTQIRLFDHSEYVRVVLELSEQAPYETHVIGSPPRLYIDIDGIWIEAPQRRQRTAGGSGPLLRVRGGQNTLTRARVVLELDGGASRHRTFHLQKPFRIVTDVYRNAPPGSPGGPTNQGVGPGTDFDTRPVQRVVIDPGHGGKDPGAIGHGKLREKDVVLRISREVAKRLRAKGLQVFLTRESDRYLSLEQRTHFANQKQADLFVSIHANASRNRKTHGVESYLLDTRYDRQTARVAARENGTTVDQLSEVQRILASLRLGYNERYAARLASSVHGSLVQRLTGSHRRTRDLGVKRGPFLVLFMADMPAILVEVGFVSNRSEAKRMRGNAFASAAARGLADGILAYRVEHARRLIAGR